MAVRLFNSPPATTSGCIDRLCSSRVVPERGKPTTNSGCAPGALGHRRQAVGALIPGESARREGDLARAVEIERADSQAHVLGVSGSEGSEGLIEASKAIQRLAAQIEVLRSIDLGPGKAGLQGRQSVLRPASFEGELRLHPHQGLGWPKHRLGLG